MFKNVLLPVDLGHESSWSNALPAALVQCRISEACLHLATILPDYGMPIVAQYFPKGFNEKAGKKILKELRSFANQHIPKDIECRCAVGQGNIYESILKIADNSKADLVVVASGRPELANFLLGPNTDRIVRHAKCTVMVVR